MRKEFFVCISFLLFISFSSFAVDNPIGEDTTKIKIQKKTGTLKKSFLVGGELVGGFVGAIGFPYISLITSPAAVYIIGNNVGEEKKSFVPTFEGALLGGASPICYTICECIRLSRYHSDSFEEIFFSSGPGMFIVFASLITIPIGSTIGYNVGNEIPLIGAEWIAALLGLTYPNLLLYDPEIRSNWQSRASLFTLGESICAALGTYSVGKWIGKKKGNLTYALIGATIGAIGSLALTWASHDAPDADKLEMIAVLNPILIPIGAVIGYNF